VLLAGVECRTGFFISSLVYEAATDPGIGVVKGQADGKDLGGQIDGGEDSVVLIDVVYIYHTSGYPMKVAAMARFQVE